MAIPLISNIGYTEVSSAGTLNDKAGETKSKLPVQYFKLTDNITGNLTLNNDSAHKKIILDTNGNTIINSSGVPLTTNSSTTLELKGSGNIQSTLKTFTSSVASTSNTGTTVPSNSDSSTMVVTTTTTDTTQTASYTVTPSWDAGNFQWIAGFAWNVWPSAFQDANGLNGGGTLTSGTQFIGVTSSGTSSSPYDGNYLSLPRGCGSSTSLINESVPQSTGDAVFYQNCASGNPHEFRLTNLGSDQSSQPADVKAWLRLPSTQNNRVLTFTNNLAISCVLSGDDPYSDVTVSAGATAVVTRSDSTDGSFDLTGTISGSNGSSQPYALVPHYNGTGSINTDVYTGTFSASAL